MRRSLILPLLSVFAAGLPACNDAGPVVVAFVDVAPDSVELHLTESAQLSATPRDPAGNALTGRDVQWSLSGTGIAVITQTGLVTGVATGSVTAIATSEGRTGTARVAVTLVAVASVDIGAAAGTLELGQTLQLGAVARDATGATALGWTVAWSSSDTAVARVSAAGLVQAVAVGGAVITATAGGRQDTHTVTIQPLSADIRILGAEFTQGVQTSDGQIPLVLNGGAAVVNVRLTATRLVTSPTQLLLRLTDSAGAEVHSDTVVVGAVATGTPSWDAPTAQFLVPAVKLGPGLAWRVVRDPRGALPDDSAASDSFPRTGPAPVTAIEVPPLRVRFVPIMLTSHGNVTGNATAANLTAYLPVLNALMPRGALAPTIGPTFATSAVFGAPPNGGAPAFWTQVLQELDAARMMDPTDGDAHWVGVVTPPPGFTFTVFGGFGYIPAAYTADPNTRTAALVAVGWFTRESQTRELVAHELGHNFGRRHAPCGGAGSPDASFPRADGTIGTGGHDVYAWASGAALAAAAVAPSTGDIMGYCTPVWASAYTYQGVLAFRGSTPAAPAPRQPATRALLIRGSVDEGRITLAPAIAVTARPTPARGGSLTAEAFADDGRLLFRQAVEPVAVDHSAARHFTVLAPLSDDAAATIAVIRVRGGGAAPGELRATATAAAAAAGARPGVERAGGTSRVTCPAGARAVVVQDAGTGAVLGIGRGDGIAIPAPRGAMLAVACSDGVRSSTATLTVP